MQWLTRVKNTIPFQYSLICHAGPTWLAREYELDDTSTWKKVIWGAGLIAVLATLFA